MKDRGSSRFGHLRWRVNPNIPKARATRKKPGEMDVARAMVIQQILTFPGPRFTVSDIAIGSCVNSKHVAAVIRGLCRRELAMKTGLQFLDKAPLYKLTADQKAKERMLAEAREVLEGKNRRMRRG